MTRIPILVGWFSRDISRIELDCLKKKRKVLSGGNKKDKNDKHDQNCKKFVGGHESAKGPRLKIVKIDKDATNLTKFHNLDGGQNKRACANRCDKR